MTPKQKKNLIKIIAAALLTAALILIQKFFDINGYILFAL